MEQTTNAIIYASGLPDVKPEELVLFENVEPGQQAQLGQVLSLGPDIVEILVLSENRAKNGTKVVRTNESLKVPVGSALLGNVIDPLGKPLESPSLKFTPLEYRLINNAPTGILTRKAINKPFHTGVSLVDLVIPLGQGQRELIIGDRKTGKTDFLLQAVLSQAKNNNICIYGAIGKRKIDIKTLKEFFTKNNIMDRIVIVASGSDYPPGIIYLTPYTAMTLAEYFRDEGNDVLLVLDDMSTHAKFYREISLLGKKFPGRNSYPGDIFYTHAKLLERAGNFITSKGQNSITCLPVAETIQGDLSGYIQTNLMSMTDGHLYFDADLFTKGRRPAINPFLSVSRVGPQTQSHVKRQINREILSFMTLFEKMQSFTHFGAELNQTAKIMLDVGEKMIRFFDQQPSVTIPINVQILLFSTLWNNIKENNTLYDKIKILEKIVKLYEEKEDIRKTIDAIIDNSTSFNELLGMIKQKGEEILASINKYG